MYTLSYSQLKTYISDRQAWYQRYIQKIDNKTYPALLVGTAFHSIIEDTINGDPLEAPDTYIKRAFRSGQELELKGEEYDTVYQQMLADVDTGMARFYDLMKLNLLPIDLCGIQAEQGFALDVGEGTCIRGFMDGVLNTNEGAEIVDWKLVGKWGDTFVYYLQALTYVMAMTAMGEDVKVMHFVEISKKQFKTKSAQWYKITSFTEFPQEDLDALKELYRATTKEIMTGEQQYLPNVFTGYHTKEAWEYWKQRCAQKDNKDLQK